MLYIEATCFDLSLLSHLELRINVHLVEIIAKSLVGVHVLRPQVASLGPLEVGAAKGAAHHGAHVPLLPTAEHISEKILR